MECVCCICKHSKYVRCVYNMCCTNFCCFIHTSVVMNVECARAEVYNYHFPKDNSGERLYCCCKQRNVPVWAVCSMQLTYASDPSFCLAAEGFMSDATVDIVLPDVTDGGTYSAVNRSCCIFWTNWLYLTVYVQIYSTSTCSWILKWSHTPFGDWIGA